MAYFTKEYLNFFKELEKNNSKEWFDENRKTYEKEVKVPFRAFAGELITAMEFVLGPIPMVAKDAVSRINRDIRFSKDKTPYNIFLGAMVGPGGKKDMTNPGLYLQANHQRIRVHSGAYALDKHQLQAVREHIAQNMSAFEKVISEKKFVSTFGEVRGEKNKRIPKEFRELAEQQPLLFNKSFYYFFDLEAKILTQDDLIPQIVEQFKKSIPVGNFFKEALAKL